MSACICGAPYAGICTCPESPAAPEPMQLKCPACQLQHIDTLDAATGIDWATRPHKTHLCLGCDHLWRPREYPTVGVAPASPEMPEGLGEWLYGAGFGNDQLGWRCFLNWLEKGRALLATQGLHIVSEKDRAVLEAMSQVPDEMLHNSIAYKYAHEASKPVAQAELARRKP